MSGRGLEPIRLDITIDAPPDQVFRRFVEDIGRWWPMAYSWAGARFAAAIIEPRPGGRWFERSVDGAESPWGEVRVFEPGRRLVASFNAGPDRVPEPPERQSEVEFGFSRDGDGTRVSLEHRDLARHGAGAGRLREGMASDQGWPLILASFAREMRYSR